MIKVNLVPQEILKKEEQRRQMVLVGIGAGALAVVFAAISFMHFHQSVTLAKDLEEAQAKYKKLEAIVKQVEALEAQARAVKARLKVMQDLDRARPFYPRFMTEFVKMIPNGIALPSFTVRAAGDKKLTITMPATASSIRTVTDWFRSLEDSEIFSGQTLSGLTFAADGKISFTMTTTYTEKKEEPEK